jgi:ParB family transcriptional regulator, chromosome partitioning protein
MEATTTVVTMNPFRCRMWEHHDRLESGINEKTCKAEIESFLKHGQLVQVLGRPLRGDPNHDVELIFGARRLFVAQHLNCPIRVEIRPMSDMEAVIAMDVENRQRQEISPYEQGQCYARWLRTKFFDSQDDIARTLNVSTSQISRMLKLSRLPAVIVGAFDNPANICETWGLDLMQAWEDPGRRSSMGEKARAISAQGARLPAREVYKQLVASRVKGRQVRSPPHDEVVTNDDDVPLFRVRRHMKWISLMLPADQVSATTLREVCTEIAGVLQRATTQARDSSRTRSLAVSRKQRMSESLLENTSI